MSLLKLWIFHPILMLSAFSGTADGFYEYTLQECVYSTSDYSDMVYLQSKSFNKFVDVQCNSTLGKCVGYTEEGVKYAEDWNKNPAYMQQLKTAVDTFCRHNAQISDSAVRDKAVQPKVTLSSVKQAEGNHPAVLMCSAYEFYPEKIKVYWLRNGEVVTTDVTSTMELADGDWYYQIHSELEYTPKSGEKISCVVEHASSTQPIVKEWDSSMPESDRNKIAIGASGLVLGIIIAAAGLIYYKKKSSGRILVPN
ncbi:H-2 class II histocompatibility antigen, E-S beta chain-like isoform X2 [Ctenopharyngodon idella]|uniref:H-2 class II histocompatibility antigen, E-S beta chain-like isoform X2 n=1 Tax=Ctenopharyngodon idella TaxID=7959 RepID=UPI00223029D5|nr:H-2 class II histocompatibility antigen, E-S beta chain-like isoform X2 [Ctenopharyngodon idella]